MKFNEVDRVRVIKGQYLGEVGTVVEVVEPAMGEDGYYIIQTRPGGSEMRVTEDSLASYPLLEYSDDAMMCEKILEYYKTGKLKPDLFVGDVVEYIESDIHDIHNKGTEYVVTEVVEVNNGSLKDYEYSIFPLNWLDRYNESMIIRVRKSKLKWKYNDKNLKEYFTESGGYNLPAWRRII